MIKCKFNYTSIVINCREFVVLKQKKAIKHLYHNVNLFIFY